MKYCIAIPYGAGLCECYHDTPDQCTARAIRWYRVAYGVTDEAARTAIRQLPVSRVTDAPEIIYYHEHYKREMCALNAGSKVARGGECVVNSEGDCGGSGWYWRDCGTGTVYGPFATEADAEGAYHATQA
jgi:hypothetical protein